MPKVGAGGEAPRPWVVDTHAFAFSPIFLRENRLPEEIDGTFDTMVEDMDRAGVERTLATVFVTKQDDLFGSVRRGLARHGGRIAVQINLAPNAPKWAAANVRASAQDGAVAGARAALSLFEARPSDEAMEEVWDACEQARLPVQVVVDASAFCEPASFASLARARPELKLVLALTRRRHAAGLAPLGKLPCVHFQLPGLLDAEVRSGDPALLRWAARRLPSDRVMFGSDRLGRESSYFAKVRALSVLPPALRERWGRQNALDLYGPRLRG